MTAPSAAASARKRCISCAAARPGCLDRLRDAQGVFDCPGALDENAEAGILKAVGFELMWLKNKRDFYGAIYEEDHGRIDMLQSRYDQLIELAGGRYS